MIIAVFVLACADKGGGGSGQGAGGPKGGTAGSVGGMAGAGDFGNGNAGTSGQAGTSGGGNTDGGLPGGGSSRDPISIDHCAAGSNPAGLADADVQKLLAGSGGAGSLRVLYPYDGTVFPRGMLAPMLMWDGATADAVYVHIKSMAFEYKGCLKPTAAGQLQLPQDIWDKAGQQTFGKNDPYTLELTTLGGGTVTGPFSQTIKLAQATIKGSIYYNSYSSRLASMGAIGGMVLRIPAGGQVEAFSSSECNGCHSVSADGSRMISQTLGAGGRAYSLAGGAPNPTGVNAGPRAAFGALYPDGSKFLQTSTATEVARAALTGGNSPTDAQLYDAATGMVVTGNGIPKQALMPVFSPSGKKLAFTDFAISAGGAIALMDYDTSTDTASGQKTLYTESASGMKPAWPFFFPDENGVVFARTNSLDFSGGAAGIAGASGPFGELAVIDVKSGTATVLALAMGYKTIADAASGTTYLPFGAAELHQSYYPTVSPVAAGGYFWVFFDGMRHYGNMGLQRQLWGFAVDISPDGTYVGDPSHPAFYLPGQEFGTGNHRAFAALDPCKMEGDSCTSGIDCCGGFCNIPESDDAEFGVDPVGTCTEKPPTCSKRDERCKMDSDCCPPVGNEPQNTCIAGFCAYVPPLE